MKKGNKTFAIISSIILGIYSLFIMFLVIWAFMSSFKSNLDFRYHPLALPSAKYGWNIKNFITAYKVMRVPLTTDSGIKYIYATEMLMNSIFYTIGCTIVSVFVLKSFLPLKLLLFYSIVG